MTTGSKQHELDFIRSEINSLVKKYAEIACEPKPFLPGQSPVPVSGKVIGSKEFELMVEASLDGLLTTGRFNTLF